MLKWVVNCLENQMYIKEQDGIFQGAKEKCLNQSKKDLGSISGKADAVTTI